MRRTALIPGHPFFVTTCVDVAKVVVNHFFPNTIENSERDQCRSRYLIKRKMFVHNSPLHADQRPNYPRQLESGRCRSNWRPLATHSEVAMPTKDFLWLTSVVAKLNTGSKAPSSLRRFDFIDRSGLFLALSEWLIWVCLRRVSSPYSAGPRFQARAADQLDRPSGPER